MLTTSIDCIPEASHLDVFLEVTRKLRELAVRQARYEKLVPSIETVKYTVIIAAIHLEFPSDDTIATSVPAEEGSRMRLANDSSYVTPTDNRNPDGIDTKEEEDMLNERFNNAIEDLQSIPEILQHLVIKPHSLNHDHNIVYQNLVDSDWGTEKFEESEAFLYSTYEADQLTHGGLLLADLVNVKYPERKAILTDIWIRQDSPRERCVS